MTKSELAAQNVYLQGKTFDFEVPIDFVQDMNFHGVNNLTAVSCFVWLYDEHAKFLGRPYPLNAAGWVACKIAGIDWLKGEPWIYTQ